MVDNQSIYLDRCLCSHLCFPALFLGVPGRLWSKDGDEEAAGTRVDDLNAAEDLWEVFLYNCAL